MPHYIIRNGKETWYHDLAVKELFEKMERISKVFRPYKKHTPYYRTPLGEIKVIVKR